MKNVVLLDSDSNITILRNKDYAERVWDAKSLMSAEMISSVMSA